MTSSYESNYITLESMSQAVWYNRWTLKKFEKYLQGDMLEIGCGIGNFTQTLQSYGRVWAFDNDPYCVAATKKNVLYSEFVGKGDIEKGTYFFTKRQFDAIVCMNVLEHIKDDNAALKHIFSLVKPKGHVILLIPIGKILFGSIDKAIHHYRRYEVIPFLDQLKNHRFTIVYRRKINMIGALGWFISGRILRATGVKSKQLRMFNALAPYILPIEDVCEPPLGTSLLVVAKRQ